MNQAKVRRACFEANKFSDESGKIWLTCQICGGRIDPGRERWEADHVIAQSIGGGHGDNVRPAHWKCHQDKTATEDTPRAAKSKRQLGKHFGIIRKDGFRRVAGIKYSWKTGRYEKATDTVSESSED